MKLAYLTSAYPAISHTFILREVESLRRRGLDITTFSIRRAPAEQILSAADRAAAETTVAILPPRWGRLLATHPRLLLRAPRAYISTLRAALALAPPGLRGRLWQLFYFIEAVVLWRECERRGIRHVHVHLANAAADLALIAARLGSTLDPARPWSWSFTMHGPTEFYDLRHFRLPEKVKDAAFVVCISDFARSQLMGLSDPETWERLHVVHVGIPIEQFTPSRNGNGAEPAAPTILYVGRLVPEKGQAVLLQAVARLCEAGRKVNVVLVGEGALRPHLEALCRELEIEARVSFLGAVGQDRIRNLYAEASIFCLPSFAEGVPVVLMEAMAMGLPVVTTRIAGIPELVEDGAGVVVAPGRVDELAERITALLDDPEYRQRLGTRGREKVLADFDAQSSAEQMHDLFTRLCPPS
jgi:colanic acid/amylovoran biosynthesis glycosyltransferase